MTRYELKNPRIGEIPFLGPSVTGEIDGVTITMLLGKPVFTRLGYLAHFFENKAVTIKPVPIALDEEYGYREIESAAFVYSPELADFIDKAYDSGVERNEPLKLATPFYVSLEFESR